MSDVPDRIMVSVDFERLGRIKVKTSCVTVGLAGVPEPFEPARYLLSTPSREHAVELVEALEYAHTALGYASEVLNITNTRNCVLVGARDIADLLTKIKEASNA